MPGNGDDTQPTMTYPTVEQHAQWKRRAEEMDMSLSEWVASMAEAGHKKFDAQVEPEVTNKELREQRATWKREAERKQSRINELEERLHSTQRATVKRFISENPGVTFKEIVHKLTEKAGEHAQQHLDDLEGEGFREEGDGWYPPEVDNE